MPTYKDYDSTTRRKPSKTTQPGTVPVVEMHKKVTFSLPMLVEALNSAYPDLNIGPGAQLFVDAGPGGHCDRRQIQSPIGFEWDEMA